MKRAGAYYQLVYHFVWSTKNRLPLLTPIVEGQLYPFLRRKCKALGYVLRAANGTENRLHLLVELTPIVRLADVAKNLKGASSHFINKECGLPETLYGQDGYGVITVRQAETTRMMRYIERQKEHHRTGKTSGLLEKSEAG